jgi:hypothetical protein
MDGLKPSRRRFLAGAVAGGVGAAAGCLGITGDESDDSDGATLTLSLSRVDGSLHDRYVLDREAPADRWDEAALDAAVAGDSYTTQHGKPFSAGADDPEYAAHEGTYYRLGSVVVDEVTETYPVLRLYGADEAVESAVEAGEDGPLPKADRRAVRIAHFAARARGNVGGYAVGLVERGGYAYRTESDRADSELLDDDGPGHISYRDSTYRTDIERERFHEAVYRPTAEPVAERPERIEAILRARLVGPRIGSDELSAEAERIVDRAAADEYTETRPYSEAFVELLRALDARPYLDGNVRKDAGLAGNDEEMIRHGEAYYERYLRLSGSVDG